mgnify:CR=1 FL=1
MTRDVVTQARRIVIKIGSSSLTGKDGAGLNSAAVSTLVDAVAQLKKDGKEVIVVSSGAIAAGLAPLVKHEGRGRALWALAFCVA